MEDGDRDIFGNTKPLEESVSQADQTDPESGGYRFIMYGPHGRRGKKAPPPPKDFDPGAPVEVHLSSKALPAKTEDEEDEEEKKAETPAAESQEPPKPAPGVKRVDIQL